MKLRDESAQARIGRTRIFRVGGVHKLVAVVIHFHSAARTIILTAILATAAILTFFRSVQRYLLTTLAQRLSHPDQFPEKFICAPDVGIIEESAVLGKDFLHAREIHIPENRNQTQFSHHWQQVFDHSCAAEWSSRYPHNADSLMNIFFEATVQDML